MTQRKPTSAADDIVLVQVLRFLGLLCTLMPVAEGLLLLYAMRDHMLPLLPPGACRPRVQCAVIDLLTCLARGERAYAAPDSSVDSSADGTDCDAQALAAETVRVCDDAGVLGLAVDIASAAPSLASLQAFGQVVDDVRPHALGLIDALLCGDVGVAVLDRSSPLLEKVTRCLVDVVSSFRSPDSAARAASLRHALTVCAWLHLAFSMYRGVPKFWTHFKSILCFL
jgi:hypothetical protein